MNLRRVTMATLSASAIALVSLIAPASAASGDGSSSAAAATVKAQCSASITDADAPVLAPLIKAFDANLVKTVFGFLTNTPFGKVLAGKEAYSCVANMNGTVLGETLRAGLQNPICAPFVNITDVKFVQTGLKLLTDETFKPTITDTLKFIKSIPSEEINQFCTLYTDNLVPCIASQLLPSLAVVRTKYSNGCCADWVDQVLDDYGYSLSGQLTKIAQLFGDVMCATQTPAFDGTPDSQQRCGYTLIQTLITKPDEASTAASVLKNLQVPTDQMCLRAEGKPYVDINGNDVPSPKASEPTPSGCVLPLDRATSWIYGLPSTSKSEKFDVKALFETGKKCLQGDELFPTITYLLPDLALDELKVYFSKSCVHLPMKFADKCTYSRPATLVEWASEPLPVKKTDAPPAVSEENGAPLATSSSTSPTPSTTSGAAASGVAVAASVAAVAAAAWTTATLALY